ncbi:A/G-specific adenine glycosylase [Blattabacterium cuenoti]|uniref:A/G-specific adenine glycosylase n=1 Tax=Blattabacterium cuenoti TaxID=1653831 RepID=UPI00163C5AEC|nr:A/G-specific adenine glycosylase [Blattabacterium cuenoti]
MDFSKKIINWYKNNYRDLPWRKTKNPYYILVSEFMLQQTKVSQVIKYYYNFIKEFSSIKKLSEADEKDVLKKWEGLGYYSRARNLHSFAKELIKKKDNFPKSYKHLIKYKGIGPYTASAIASICFNEGIPSLDGNACRVFSRYLGINKNITSEKTKNFLRDIIVKMMKNCKDPGIFNQAIMDLGSIICTYKNPKCLFCPIKNSCFAAKNRAVDKFPVKTGKKCCIIERFFYYIILYDHKKNICIHKRSKNDIWKGLYEFPLIELKKNLHSHDHEEIIKTVWKKFNLIFNTIIYKIKHKLTHQNLSIQFLNCEIFQEKDKLIKKNEFFFIPHNKIKDYPFPRPIILFLKHNKNMI